MWLTGPAAPQHVGSSQTRARTRVPCIGRQTLSHCATREAPILAFFVSLRGVFRGEIGCHCRESGSFEVRSGIFLWLGVIITEKLFSSSEPGRKNQPFVPVSFSSGVFVAKSQSACCSLAPSSFDSCIEICCIWELPGGPVVRTPHFHWRGCGFSPSSGN